jgi:hypothetical protein
MSDKNSFANWDRYSNGVWSELQSKAQASRQRYTAGGRTDNELHRLADQLHEVTGGVQTAVRLIPLILSAEKKAVQWGLERVLVAVRRLETMPDMDEKTMESIAKQAKDVVLLVESGSLDEAERQVRALEAQLDDAEHATLDRRFTALLTTLDQQFTQFSMVQ